MFRDRIIFWIKKVFCGGLVAVIALRSVSPVFSSEPIGFYDWQAGVLAEEKDKKRCYIQFSGATRQGTFLSMHLSLIEVKGFPGPKRRMTLMKISASRADSTFSEPLPIKISTAWVETSQESSREKMKKTDLGQNDYFLGVTRDADWFEALLKDIDKEGLTLGFRVLADSTDTVLHIPPPQPHLFAELYAC